MVQAGQLLKRQGYSLKTVKKRLLCQKIVHDAVGNRREADEASGTTMRTSFWYPVDGVLSTHRAQAALSEALPHVQAIYLFIFIHLLRAAANAAELSLSATSIPGSSSGAHITYPNVGGAVKPQTSIHPSRCCR